MAPKLHQGAGGTEPFTGPGAGKQPVARRPTCRSVRGAVHGHICGVREVERLCPDGSTSRRGSTLAGKGGSEL